MSLTGKVAIVTGASRGIGRAIAQDLARRGASIAATYVSPRSEAAVAELAASFPCIGVRADLSHPDSPATIVEQTVAAYGGIDIIVNNAAVDLVKSAADITAADFDLYYVNVRAPMLLLKAALPHLRSPARIINIGSVGSRCGFRNLSMYCSSKAALEGLTRCWAAELGAAGHTVNMVNPGPVQSDMLDTIPKDLVDLQKVLTPAGNRVGTFDDVAQVVAWLAAEESRWVTGQVVSASGGYAMY